MKGWEVAVGFRWSGAAREGPRGPSRAARLNGPFDLLAEGLLVDPVHGQVALRAPLRACDVAQPDGHEHQRRLPVGEGPDDSGTTSDLAHDPLERVAGAAAAPVRLREAVVAERLRRAFSDEPCGLHQLHRLELRRADGLQLLLGLRPRLLGVDRLQHDRNFLDLALGHGREDVAVEGHHPALPLGVWEEVRERLDQAEALVRDDQLDALEPTLLEVPQEAGLAGLVLFRTFRDAQDVSVAVRIDADRDQDSHVSDLAAPAALEIDAVAVDVRVLALERRVPPALIEPYVISRVAGDGLAGRVPSTRIRWHGHGNMARVWARKSPTRWMACGA